MDLDQLEEAEARLRRQLAELAEKKKQLEEIQRKNKSINVIYLDVIQESGEWLFKFKLSDHRDDISAILNSIPSHVAHRVDRYRTIKIEDIDNLLTQLRKLRGVFFLHFDWPKIETAKNAPEYRIELIDFASNRIFAIYCKRECEVQSQLYKIPNIGYNETNKRYHIPLVYGYKIVPIFQDVKKIEWSEEALALASEQYAKRNKVDSIAQLKDIELTEHLQGVKLRPFQKVGVAFAEANGGRSLQIFDVGLGKTLIGLEATERNNAKTLIITRASLKINWERNVVKLTGKVPYVLSGMRPDNLDIMALLGDKYQYYIVNYDTLRNYDEVETEEIVLGRVNKKKEDRFWWAELIKFAKFDYMLVDECQAIRNSETATSMAVRQLSSIPKIMGLSATPLMNELGDLWSLLNLINPIEYSNKAYFLAQHTWDKRTPKDIKALHEVLSPIMIRREKCEVLADLPAIERITQYVELNPKARKIYDKIMAGIIAILDANGETVPVGIIDGVLAQLQRAKMVCSMAKQRAVADFALELADQTEHKNSKDKVIISSQYVNTVYNIGRMLGNEALAFTGRESKNERMAMVDKMQADKNIKFLAAQIHTAGEGLDITEAGYVLHADLWWNAAAHIQFEGRCYGRLNDLHGAEAFYFVCNDTIEEWIMDLIKEKMELAENTINGVEVNRSKSIASELIKKIKANAKEFRKGAKK